MKNIDIVYVLTNKPLEGNWYFNDLQLDALDRKLLVRLARATLLKEEAYAKLSVLSTPVNHFVRNTYAYKHLEGTKFIYGIACQDPSDRFKREPAR